MPIDDLDKIDPRRLAKLLNLEANEPDHPSTAGPPSPRDTRYLGDYELLEEIARGGMGLVYRTRQLSLNRLVALKVMLPGLFVSDADVARFLVEAEAAAHLDHPNIVPIYEIGEHQGTHFYSMRLIDGGNLASRISEYQSDIRKAVGLLVTVTRAIHYAHQRGILHRDLKPSNILLSSEGTPYIADLGLAKRISRDDSLTQPESILGTPGYMAPEQATAKSGQVSTAADVYSLGAILYEVLTGRPPHQADTPLGTLIQTQESEPSSVTTPSIHLSRDLETICLKCLRRDPRQRYGTAEALADDLERWLAGKPVLARRISIVGRLWRWCRRRPLVAALAGSVLVLLIVLAVGAPLAALRLNRERIATMQARDDAVQKLWSSCLARSQAERFSGRPGRRFNSLEALRQAAAIRPSVELRNEAIACMALADLRVAAEWEGFPSPGYGIAFDPDLEHYAISDGEGNISIRRVGETKEIARLPGSGDPAWVIRFSSMGRLIAAKHHRISENDANRVRVWDWARGRAVLETRHPVANAAMDFSPDDRWLAVGGPDGSLTLHDLVKSGEIRQLPNEAVLASVRFHPSEDKLAAGRVDGRVLVFDSGSGRVLSQQAVSQRVGALAWHPEGLWLAVGCLDSSIRVYDADLGRLLAVLQGHATMPTGLAFSRGRDLLASFGSDHTLRLWHPLDGVPLLTVAGVTLEGSPLFATDHRRMAFTMAGSRLTIFEMDVAPECRKLIAEPRSSDRLWHTDISRDGLLLAGAAGDGVRLWDLEHGRQVACLPGHDWRAVRFTPDGWLIASGLSGVWRWPMDSDAGSHASIGRIGPADRIAGVPDGSAEGCSLSKDGQRMAVAVAGEAVVIDIKEGREKARFTGQAGLNQAVLSPDGRWLACATWHGSGIRVFDLDNGRLVYSADGSDSDAGFSPDSRWLVTSTGAEYRLWSVGDWALRQCIPRRVGSFVPGPMTFDSSGAILAIVPTWNTVRLMDTATGQELATLEAPDVHERIQSLSFSPDDSLLAIGSVAHRLHVWDLRLVRRRLASMGLDWDVPTLPVPQTRPDTPPAGTIDAASSQQPRHANRSSPDSTNTEVVGRFSRAGRARTDTSPSLIDRR